MASELCMNCFSVKGQYEVCPYCGYVEGTPPVQPHCLTPGTILGNHFIVGTVIGFGGFGITYKCYDTTLGIIVAAKEFYPMGLVNRSPGETKVGLLSGERREQYNVQLKRFFMEAQSVAQFGKAKDIVNIYDYFEENKTAYIIMEYIDGILLKDYLEKQGAMPAEVALGVIMPIIEGVKKIHSKGIIHRDISPDNIFITDENSIKIFDFGAAQLNSSKEGMTGEKVIKVGYSAPEQYRDKSRQGFYTDIYSVGAILYQMLTGRKPIESTERERRDKLKSPLELGVKVNSNVDRAVMEAIAVQPELRYQDIRQFEEALRNKRTAEYPKDKIKKRKRKRNWIIGTAATLILAMGVGIGLYFTILKPESEIFDLAIKDDTRIMVWVENEDQKEQLETLVENGFKQGEDLSAAEQKNPEKWEKFWSENEKVDVDVEVHANIQEELESVADDKKPNMYITDHVSDSCKVNLVSLEGVYSEINIEDYAYMSEYERFFPGYKEMPTALDSLFVYSCDIKYNKDNRLAEKGLSGLSPSPIKNTSDVETVDVDDLIPFDNNTYTQILDGNKVASNKLASFYETAEAYALILQNPDDWEKVFELDDSFVPEVNSLSHMQNFNNFIRERDYVINRSSETEEEQETGFEVYGSNTVAGAGYRKKMDAAVEVSIESRKDLVNKLDSMEVYVVTQDDKMLVTYAERYGILADGLTDDQDIACKRLIYMMLQEIGQRNKEVSSSETVFPIRIEQLKDFETIRKDMKGFIDLYRNSYPCEIIGSTTGNMFRFVNELDGITNKQELQKYCSNFTKSSKGSKEEK